MDPNPLESKTRLPDLAGGVRTRRRSLSAANDLAISFVYACSDEWYQTFVPGRTGHFIDVGVDSVGMVLAHCLHRFLARKRSELQPACLTLTSFFFFVFFDVCITHFQ
jgi:hypothetical protein